MNRPDYIAVAAAFFTALFGFFGVVIREMKQTRFIIERLHTLQQQLNDHINQHDRRHRNGHRRQTEN